MAYNTRMFEHVYGSSMLDTVHNYFPEMMYDDSLFRDPTMRWMRYRISTLFPQQYAQKQNEYRIYQSVNRRVEFSNWQSVNPPHYTFARPPPINTAIPSPNLGMATPVRTTIRTGVINIPPPLGPSTGATEHEEGDLQDPLQTPQQQPRARTLPALERTRRIQRQTYDMEGIVTNLFGGMLDGMGEYEPLWGGAGGLDATTAANANALLNILATATMIPTNTAFQDVVVAPTQAQIDAGSTIVNYADLPRDTSCAICQEDAGDSVWRRLHCNHYFHRGCVDPWFQRNTHCPVCRADIRESEQTRD